MKPHTKLAYGVSLGGLLLLAVCVGVVLVHYRAFRQESVDALTQAAIDAAAVVDVNGFQKLSAQTSDSILPEYVHMRNQLIALHRIYSDVGVRGFYTMRQDSRGIVFEADSAETSDPWHSEPGTVYEKAPADLTSVFAGEGKISFVGPYTDEFGTFYSIFVPFTDAQRNVVAVLGTDVDASTFSNTLRNRLLIDGSIALVVLLTYLMLGYILTRYLETEALSKEKDRLNQSILVRINEAETLKREAETRNAELLETKKATLNILEDIQKEKRIAQMASIRLGLATKSAKMGVWEWDVVKNVLVWDDQMYALYGIKKEDFGAAYDAWQKGLHPDDKKPGDDAIQAALKGEKDFSTNFRVVWPSGEIHVIQAHAIVERNNSGTPLKMIGVNWDITKESIVDREKTEFVSLASHQLKTPIGSIQWNLEMLQDGDYGKLSKKQMDVLKETYTMSTRMNDLVNALLNISRIEMGVFIIEPTPTDFAKLCDEVLAEMEPRRAKKSLELTKEFQENIPQISADFNLLRVVFQNFISNAIKYTSDKGKIGVSLATDEKNIIFSVANNGEPIPKAEQARIFTKLFRASNAQAYDADGNGLGLYVVKQIVENAGGKIWFTSKKGEDTVFACSFPLTGMIAKSGTKQLS